ncbi:putative WRKY transcription factor 28 [Apostasia shenzhenica]|uniref:Putative WRKY transcription factor 28 n=1 Tax=Apostasia shenzhenica TaxID=1088818 RepID=A0A2I0A0H4_9ASPA|nr:putative WRKY transcription factor 28 [Apostasia shenzhenica]
MSGEKGRYFHHDSSFDPYSFFAPAALSGDPPLFTDFADFPQISSDYGLLARAFDLTCSPEHEPLRTDAGERWKLARDGFGTELTAAVHGNHTEGAAVGGTTRATANSSASSSSTEAAAEEVSGKHEKDQEDEEVVEEGKRGGDVDDGSDPEKANKKLKKTMKKGEKRQRQPRFAFMTKSEVDHLEDGYRWRKYGQKAVKNSPYPRSYYRCTTQKCAVKKRVERSCQDPAIVITTYEGQHTHHCPATVRGSSNLLEPSPASSSFRHDFLFQQLHAGGVPGTMEPSHHYQQVLLPDYGLLQDMISIRRS